MQFLLKEKPDKEGLVRLRDKDYHYLVHVRRLKPGSVFSAFLPAAEKTQTTPQHVTVTVQNIERNILIGSVSVDSASPSSDLPPIILFQALPKGTKMDLIVRQAAELGISEIVPFISEHTVPKKGSGKERLDRWRRIIKEARQQSGSTVDTQIHEILNTEELFAYWQNLQKNSRNLERKPAEIPETSDKALGLIFSPWSVMDGGGKNTSIGVFAKQKLQSPKSAGTTAMDGGGKSASAGVFTKQKLQGSKSTGAAMDGGGKNTSIGVFAKQKLQSPKSAGTLILGNPLEQSGFHRYLYKKPPLLVLAVGPEGGFSNAELDCFIEAGFEAISLGNTVLRTETAALYGAAAVKIILMERALWKPILQ